MIPAADMTSLRERQGKLPCPRQGPLPRRAIKDPRKHTKYFRGSHIVELSVDNVGEQSDLTGSLDRLCQLALMHGADAGGAAGQDLAAL